MTEPRATMATPAKNPYLINKITFFQFGIFIVSCKYTLTNHPYTDEIPCFTTVASANTYNAMQ